ncbi:PAS domain S-box protein [Acuticoccus yangtzensis]|uniref:PAS domain S-box protein n=1 Tax=Acuticoccus yangtzensis TaxID=1443441 RepID=UPI000B0149F4|nr:PAS domain S-box protein [Acuticoccus yangtzensis]
MTDDEALREALLEITHLRAREAAALREANALLRGIQRMNTAPTPGAALIELLHSIASTMQCDCVAVVHDHDGDALFHPKVGGKLGRILPGAGAQVTKKSRLVLDLALTTWWAQETGPYRSLALVPIAINGEAAAIACFSAMPGSFTKADIALLNRLSELAAQALATQELAERNALLAAVIDGAPLSVTIADATRQDAPLIYVNDAFCRMTGYERREVLGRNCRFVAADPPASPERQRLRRAVETRGTGQFELTNRRRDGSTFNVDLTLYPVVLQGQRHYLVASQTDTTERRAAERERDDARHRMVAALSEASEGFLILDEAGKVVLANAPWRSFFPGAPCGWAEGRQFVDIWADRLIIEGLGRAEATERAAARLAAMRTGRRDHEEVLSDGRVVLLSETGFAGSQCLCVATDVTRLERSKRELALRAAAIEGAQDGIAITNEAGHILYMNSAYLAMFGYDHGEVLGRPWLMLYGTEEADRLQRHAVPLLTSSGSWRGEIPGRHKSGAKIDQELSLTLLRGIGLVCLTRDIGSRKRQEAENLRLREQLHAAQRQEAIGVIAAGVAHDFNNVIAAIAGSATLVAESEEVGEGDRAHARRILTASERAKNLVGRLLDFGKRRSTAKRINVAESLAEASDLIAASVTAAIDVHLEIPDEAVPVVIDSTDFLQIVLNFVINARDAITAANGQITVELVAEADPAAFGTAVIGSARPGTLYSAVTVTDNGSGIDPGRFGAIFEPYISTKGKDGTGLGLAVVAELVREADGIIAIRSTLGEGTVFTVLLPCADQPRSDEPPTGLGAGTRTGAGRGTGAGRDSLADLGEGWKPAERTALNPMTGSAPDLAGRILLVVDDDVEAGAATAAALERMGAEVAQCNDPEDALDAVRDDPEAWDALITDFEMPKLNGGALCAAVHALRRELPCVCVTGRRDVRLSDAPFAAVLTKPVNPSELAATVAAALIRKERVLQ